MTRLPDLTPADLVLDELRTHTREGASDVHRTRLRDNGRVVAVKVFGRRPGDPAAARRFRREVNALGRLREHPALVNGRGAGRWTDGRPFVVTDWMAGGSLAERLAAHGPMPWPEVVVLGTAVAAGLAAAHTAGVLHRDVKPSNLLADDHGRWRLTDFDVARTPTTTVTPEGHSFASFAHAPPEAFAGGPAEVTRDVYSLASTLVEALTGRPPYGDPEGTPMVTMLGQMAARDTPPVRLDGIPAPLETVLMDALHKDPRRRPPSAAAFGERLRAATDPGATRIVAVPLRDAPAPPGGAPPTVTARSPRLPRARGAMAGAGLAAAGFLAAMGLGVSFGETEATDTDAASVALPADAAATDDDGATATTGETDDSATATTNTDDDGATATTGETDDGATGTTAETDVAVAVSTGDTPDTPDGGGGDGDGDGAGGRDRNGRGGGNGGRGAPAP